MCIFYLLIESIPAYIKVIFLQKRGKLVQSEMLAFNKINSTAKRFLEFAKIPVEVLGAENIPKDRGVLYICNHQGYYDIPILLAALKGKTSYISKIELIKVPILSRWMKIIGCIFIDRANVRQSFNEIKKATKLIERGISVVIFPEGIVSGGSVLGNFKSGAFRFAIENKITIVPVTLKGEYNDFREKQWIKPKYMRIYLNTPINTNNLSIKDHKILSGEVKSKIVENLKR